MGRPPGRDRVSVYDSRWDTERDAQQRDSLTLMVDAIAGMDGLQDVRTIFAGAVPVLSKYLEFSDS